MSIQLRVSADVKEDGEFRDARLLDEVTVQVRKALIAFYSLL